MFLPGRYCSKATTGTASAGHFKYDFGGTKATPGYTLVSALTNYDEATDYGFEKSATLTAVEHGGSNALADGFVTRRHLFYFSVKLPEGNYNVRVGIGTFLKKFIRGFFASSIKYIISQNNGAIRR
ncbi:MAG: hypothetical protein WKF97_08520 [Chitinophagaceae bacterium]